VLACLWLEELEGRGVLIVTVIKALTSVSWILKTEFSTPGVAKAYFLCDLLVGALTFELYFQSYENIDILCACRLFVFLSVTF
jgi:hypothetical protein